MTSDPTTSNDSSARANSFPWPPVLYVGAIVTAFALDWALPIAWPGIDDTAARLLGYSFGIASIVLVVWAIVELRRANTTVMPDGISSTLVTTGPYSYFRNPIYLGEVLLLFCAAEITKNVWFVIVAFVFAALVIVLQILPEERHLTARFGEAYEKYRSRTRRRI